MDAMEQLEAEGYTHYQCVYYSRWYDKTFMGNKYPIHPLDTTARHFSENFQALGDIAEIILYKE